MLKDNIKKCSYCDAEINVDKDTYFECQDNFIQIKYFDTEDENIFCCKECFCNYVQLTEIEPDCEENLEEDLVEEIDE